MSNVVCTIHGWEIHVSPFSSTYWVYYYDYETRKAVNKEWKTLKGAIRWCEKH